jgi:hypothetical protein
VLVTDDETAEALLISGPPQSPSKPLSAGPVEMAGQ